MKLPVVAYVRVSDPTRQDHANQRPDIERLCVARCDALPDWREEGESAAKRRPVLEALLDDCRRGEVGTLVVWSLDCLGRGTLGNMMMVAELDRLGVQLLSVREPWLDTDPRNPTRTLLLAIFSWVAEQERARIVERTKAGVDRARAKGKHVGRPVEVVPRAHALHAQHYRTAGVSWAIVSAELALHGFKQPGRMIGERWRPDRPWPPSTLARAVAALEEKAERMAKEAK